MLGILTAGYERTGFRGNVSLYLNDEANRGMRISRAEKVAPRVKVVANHRIQVAP